MNASGTFTLGKDGFTGRPINISAKELLSHGMIVGGTGRGKSKFLELAARQFMDSETPLLVLDPHGDTVRALLEYVTYRRFDNRLIYIDPNQAVDEAVFPLNFLQRSSDDISTHASHIMRAIAKVFGEEESQTKPRLERRERATLMALIEASLSMAEMLHFLSISDPTYRQHVLHSVRDPYVRTEWAEYDSIPKRAEREQLLESCLNRAAKIILNEPVRRCLGAPTCSLDWDEIIRGKKIVLVNLQASRVSQECMQLMGILIVDHLVRYGLRATTPLSRPLYVLCDELDELSSPDLSRALQALRKRRIFIWGCIQHLEQLRSHESTAKLYHAFMSCADIKLAFHTTYEDAKVLVHELFAGEFRGDIVKHEIYRTDRVPRESVRRVLTTTEHQSDTNSVTDGSGSSFSTNNMHTDLSTHAAGMTETLGPDGSITSRGANELSSHGASSAHGSSEGSSSQHTEGSAQTLARGSSISHVPFYEFIERQELSSRTYYSIEELVEKYISFLQCQPERHAQVKIRDQKGAPVVLSFVDSAGVRAKHVSSLVQRNNTQYALLPPDIDRLLEQRLLLPGPTESDSQEPTGEETRWE